MKKRLKRKGLSAVIAVVILIAITFVTAGIIAGFVVPFAKKNLSRGGECFEALDNIIFEPTDFNCFVEIGPNQPNQRTGFSVRIENENIIGFRVGLFSQGNSITRDIIDGKEYNDVRMLTGNFANQGPNDILKTPKEGEVRTYVAKGTFDRAELAPILLSGEQCDLAEDIKIKECISNEAIDLIKSP